MSALRVVGSVEVAVGQGRSAGTTARLPRSPRPGNGTPRTPTEEVIKGEVEQRAPPVKAAPISRSANASEPATDPLVLQGRPWALSPTDAGSR